MAGETTSLPPVINMSNFPAELERVAAASAGLGCFRVINHGIPTAMMAEGKAAARSLFELPTDTKLRNTDNIILSSGYIAPTPKQPLFESLGICDAASGADVLAFCSSLEVSPGHQEVIIRYASKVHSVTTEIASKVAESLGLVGVSFKDWPCHMRFNHYCTTKESIGSSALHIHTDSSFITLIQDDESVDGLEILDSNGHFVAINPMPATFLVLVGDLGKAWSNGRLNNVKHRVLCKQAGPRFTIGFAAVAPKGGKIEPQPELIDDEHPRHYETFTFDDYRKLRHFSGLLAGEILSAFCKE